MAASSYATACWKLFGRLMKPIANSGSARRQIIDATRRGSTLNRARVVDAGTESSVLGVFKQIKSWRLPPQHSALVVGASRSGEQSSTRAVKQVGAGVKWGNNVASSEVAP